MCIDNIINFCLNIFDSKKSQNNNFIINKNFLYKENSKILKIILPPRGDGDLWITKNLMKRLYDKGYSCLEYYFNGEILKDNPEETLGYFKNIQDYIIKDIDNIKIKYKFDQIDIIAPSLGVVSACLVSNNNININNLYLIVPGDSLASSLWDGIRTKNIKKIYEKQGITKEKLENIWETLAPENNIDGLKNKNIFIEISKSDKIIPYKNGKRFTEILKLKYPNNIKIKENLFLGHYLTVIKNYLVSNNLMR